MKVSKLNEELRAEGAEALHERLAGERGQLFRLRISAMTAHVKDYSQFKKGRRTIARMLTHLREKDFSEGLD